MSERLSTILNGLNHKAALKQEVYDITVKCFSELRSCVADIQDELAPKILPENASVEVIMSDYGDFEFHLKSLLYALNWYGQQALKFVAPLQWRRGL